jgi:hypothetical protein
VTSVFAVNLHDSNEVIAASRFTVLNTNLISASFDFGPPDFGKTFLIFASGPNGTSRNLTGLPDGAPPGCPLGNEQGIQVTFQCGAATAGEPAQDASLALTSCVLVRNASGSFSLTLGGTGFKDGLGVTVGGLAMKKVKLKDEDPVLAGAFRRVVVKGKVCRGLPGFIVASNPDGASTSLFCGESCR